MSDHEAKGPDLDGRVEVRRTVPADAEDVYRAWTDPSLLSRWMSPSGSAETEVDLRIGGRFRVVMRGEGRTIEHTGEYLELEPGRRLAFTWTSPYTGEHPSLVTVTLDGREGRTDVVVTHERLPQDAAESHGRGWGAMIERLEVLLDGGS